IRDGWVFYTGAVRIIKRVVDPQSRQITFTPGPLDGRGGPRQPDMPGIIRTIRRDISRLSRTRNDPNACPAAARRHVLIARQGGPWTGAVAPGGMVRPASPPPPRPDGPPTRSPRSASRTPAPIRASPPRSTHPPSDAHPPAIETRQPTARRSP